MNSNKLTALSRNLAGCECALDGKNCRRCLAIKDDIRECVTGEEHNLTKQIAIVNNTEARIVGSHIEMSLAAWGVIVDLAEALYPQNDFWMVRQ